MEGNPLVDAGAYIKDGIQSLQTVGACLETEFPFTERIFVAYAMKMPIIIELHKKGLN